jgi:hypothetical protein
MIQGAPGPVKLCRLDRYTPAWAVGTGLRVTLAPGSYSIVGEEEVGGVQFLRLGDGYKVDARHIEEVS